MSIPSKQIGWSNESNLLWEISKQMERLTKVVYANAAPTSTYKVYTALLTQNGGGDKENISSGALTKGVTYAPNDILDGGWDFSNVGGPIYPDDAAFVATESIEPNSYGITSLGYDTGVPVVTVLENTIGNVWFTYDTAGQYSINSNGLFIINKTIFNGVTYYEANNASITDCISDIENNTSSTISIWSFSRADNGTIDNALNNTPIEIRVYN